MQIRDEVDSKFAQLKDGLNEAKTAQKPMRKAGSGGHNIKDLDEKGRTQVNEARREIYHEAFLPNTYGLLQ